MLKIEGIDINGASPENPLSFNERVCLALSFKGEGRKQTARALNSDIQTIKTYYRRIFDKLGAKI